MIKLLITVVLLTPFLFFSSGAYAEDEIDYADTYFADASDVESSVEESSEEEDEDSSNEDSEDSSSDEQETYGGE